MFAQCFLTLGTIVLVCNPVAAQSPIPASAPRTDSSQAASQPGDQSTSLQAVVMEVTGKARWRPNADAGWEVAAVNAVLSPGAEIRTGVRSSVGLRVGKNATVVIESGTSFILPEIVQEGATLRTRAAIKSGRADFKVDDIGLTNDFQVITPSLALAVRGTGFSVDWGGLSGVAVEGLPSNRIAAMELRYFLSNLKFFVGEGRSTEQTPDAAAGAWGRTVGVPVLLGEIASSEEFQQLLENGFAIAGKYLQQKQVQNSAAGISKVIMEVGGPGSPDMSPVFNPDFDAQAFEYLCQNLGYFADYFVSDLDNLSAQAGYPLGKGDYAALEDVFKNLGFLCLAYYLEAPNQPADPLQAFAAELNSYCNSLSASQQKSICLQLAGDLIVQFSQPYSPN